MNFRLFFIGILGFFVVGCGNNTTSLSEQQSEIETLPEAQSSDINNTTSSNGQQSEIEILPEAQSSDSNNTTDERNIGKIKIPVKIDDVVQTVTLSGTHANRFSISKDGLICTVDTLDKLYIQKRERKKSQYALKVIVVYVSGKEVVIDLKIIVDGEEIGLNILTMSDDTQSNLKVPVWKTSYLNDAKLELNTKYRLEYNATLPEKTYTWIVDHGFENSLLQATEVDPRIIKNVEEILSGLSDEVSEEYANMVFAISMARRLYGVGSFEFNNNRFGKLVSPPTESDIEKQKKMQKYSEMTESFIHDNGWNLEQSIDNMDSILNYLLDNGADNKVAKDVESVAIYIHMINDRNGLIKPRSPNASAIEYINHLASIQTQSISPFMIDGKNVDSPNMFPHTAPWPLLMPLAEMRPIDEMQWIWNRFKNATLEEKYRYRLYGNYRKPAEVIAPFIARTTYSKGSTEYINDVGGVCGTMSQVGRATFISLGVPSMGTGQPKHACITRYSITSDNQYITSLNQSISTLYNSTPDWYFFEDNSFRMNSDKISYGEYQMGLGLAMNKPLENYLDSRTLVRLANTKEGSKKKELLEKATDSSIYNAEAIYDRFDAMGRDFNITKILVETLLEKLPAIADGYSADKAPDEDLEGEDKNISIDGSIVQYRDTVIAALVTELFKKHYMSHTPLPNEYKNWIKVINANNFYDLMHYYSFEAFTYQMQGIKVRKYFKSLDADIERHAELKRQRKNIKFKEKIVKSEQLISEKQIELADENTTNKRKKALQKQIDRLNDDIVRLNTKIDENRVDSLLYQAYIDGDGLSEIDGSVK